jgi:replicative DNA helicase
MKSTKYLESLSADEQDKLLAELLNKRSPGELVNARDSRTHLTHISEHLEAAQERVKTWGQVIGLRSGYRGLDNLTMGLVGGELVIIAGPTSFGKTTLAVNMAYRIAVQQVPVMFVTLEMTKPEIVSRLMKIAEPGKVDDLPIFFQLSETLDWRDIPNLMKRAVGDGAKIIFVDYLQYLARGDDLRAEIGKITQALKRAAIKHNVPVVLLSQLRRINDRIEGKVRSAEISDLKESSYIEQDADIVLMINRDDDAMTVKVLKNRNRRGQLDETTLIMNGISLHE